MEEDVLLLEDDGLAVAVSPLGGAILSARWQGAPGLAPTPTPGLASKVFGAEACFPLVPFGNRIENNAFCFEGCDHRLLPNTADPLVLHGDGWLRRWSVVHQDRRSVTLHHRQEAGAATPFAYEAVQTISIDAARLSLSLSVTNRAPRALPYGLGFHPYFPRTPQTRLVARATRRWSEREKHLPGVEGPIPEALDFASGVTLPPDWLNNAFDGWDGRARIEWPETGLAVSLMADAPFRHFVLYSPSSEAEFICFEPMTHRPNAHHQQQGGLLGLAPGETLQGAISLHVHPLES